VVASEYGFEFLFGVAINPLILHGQGAWRRRAGRGQVLMEEVAHDPQSGQLMSASFMDYAMPRADVLCPI
jgi:aerobic carbon-monoxide dehydrogenase large subunit